MAQSMLVNQAFPLIVSEMALPSSTLNEFALQQVEDRLTREPPCRKIESAVLDMILTRAGVER